MLFVIDRIPFPGSRLPIYTYMGKLTHYYYGVRITYLHRVRILKYRIVYMGVYHGVDTHIVRSCTFLYNNNTYFSVGMCCGVHTGYSLTLERCFTYYNISTVTSPERYVIPRVLLCYCIFYPLRCTSYKMVRYCNA